MHILLKEENFRSNPMDLQRRGYTDYVFVQLGNRRGFIVSKNIDLIRMLAEKSWFMVNLEVKERVPLYKQSMQMQMGRKVEQTKTVRRDYNAQVLDRSRDNYYYNVWSIR